jgi:hypothetical protein
MIEKMLDEKNNLKKERGLLVVVVAMIMAFSVMSVSAEPYGTSFTSVSNETAPADDPQSQNATAGYVSEIDVTGISTTQTWQGYFGNITGTIQLADVNDNQMYNWTLADPEGEIYASESGTIDWSNIFCVNFTATGGQQDLCTGSGTPGETCEYGLNLTQIEDNYNIVVDDVDGVDETFASNFGGHTQFYTNNLQFSPDECPSTHLFDSTGGANDGNYEEILLYEPNAGGISSQGHVIFTSLIEGSSVNGFDGKDYDFEMLVLEDGHGTNTASTTYYFYVELQ